MTTKTEKEKMMAGELYNAFDPQLLKERQQAKQTCFEFNQTSPLDTKRRQDLVKQLFQVEDAVIESPFQCDYGYNLKLGKKFYANHGCTILDCNTITIGDNCLMAPNVVISAATHPTSAILRAAGDEYTAPIVIGNNCWLGANSTINPGVILGNGVVVGAGAVVTKNFPDNVVVAGVPAKIIRHLDAEKGGGVVVGQRHVVLPSMMPPKPPTVPIVAFRHQLGPTVVPILRQPWGPMVVSGVPMATTTNTALFEEPTAKRKRGKRGPDIKARKKKSCGRCKRHNGKLLHVCKGRGGETYCEFFSKNGERKES